MWLRVCRDMRFGKWKRKRQLQADENPEVCSAFQVTL